MNLVFFCKSYIGDLYRFMRLWESLKKNNPEKIPFYACIPAADFHAFKSVIVDHTAINWIADEDVVKSSPGGSLELYHSLDGRLSQQIIKAEAWRVIGCSNYVCFDSDCVFIRNVFSTDFLSPDGFPYTVMHQHKCFLEEAIVKNKTKYLQYFKEESKKIKSVFHREGLDFEFGPNPYIWSSRVWNDLFQKTLSPNGQTLWTAIIDTPTEWRWYGESLLLHKSIPLMPIEPLMKAFLYQWQVKKFKQSFKELPKLYLGVLIQSNWEFELDYKKKKISSIFIRKIRRLFG